MVEPKQAKVIIIGQERVGKTSIALRFCRNEYSDDEKSTINATNFTRTVALKNEQLHLSIWDTAGQERYHALN